MPANRPRFYRTQPSVQERARRLLRSLAEHPGRSIDDYGPSAEVAALVTQAQAQGRQRAAVLEATCPVVSQAGEGRA